MREKEYLLAVSVRGSVHQRSREEVGEPQPLLPGMGRQEEAHVYLSVGFSIEAVSPESAKLPIIAIGVF